jgi:hypothetical protein
VGNLATVLGATLMALGDLDGAQPLLERGIAARRAAGDPDIWESLAAAARLAIRRHDLLAAKTRLGEAAKGGSGRPIVTLANAELERAQRGCRAAQSMYQIALDAAVKGAEPELNSDAALGLAECELELGAPRRAIALLEPQLAWQERAHADARALAPTRLALARALAVTGGERRRIRELIELARGSSVGRDSR